MAATKCLSTVCDIDKYPDWCRYSPFGPGANCTLDVCCPEYSAYTYSPGLVINYFFGIAFAGAGGVHLGTGLVLHQWWFMGLMVTGCVDEVLGYAGRIFMHQNLWSFKAFMIQVVCITTAPVFFCAAIYVLLAKTISKFGRSFSRFNPSLFYWVFIPCDILSLVFQAAGGALSSISSGKNDTGVGLALAGLAFQVITLVIFYCLCVDYLWRYFNSEQFRQHANRHPSFVGRLKRFYALQSLAVIAILVRCAFRVHELKKGYTPSNEMLQQEGLFIGLEGVPTLLAALFLAVGHPGLILGDPLVASKELELESAAK